MNSSDAYNESLALLAILALGRREIEMGDYDSAEEFFDRMRKDIEHDRR